MNENCCKNPPFFNCWTLLHVIDFHTNNFSQIVSSLKIFLLLAFIANWRWWKIEFSSRTKLFLISNAIYYLDLIHCDSYYIQRLQWREFSFMQIYGSWFDLKGFKTLLNDAMVGWVNFIYFLLTWAILLNFFINKINFLVLLWIWDRK